MIRLGLIAVLLLAGAGQSLFSQTAEYVISDTLWVKVTFYDFKTNSNFGEKNCGTATGEVQDTLSVDRKPLFMKDRCANDLLDQWFRPSGGSDATFQPYAGKWTNLVNYKGNAQEWVGKAFNSADEMANVVMYDSLPFELANAATGTYTFSRTNQHPSGGFFWLDGRGFGEEPAGSGHNFYYTMELHKEFVYQGGEMFSFRGDDDVWVFINGKLALDLGGMQAETKRELSLDAIANEFGLVKGQHYPMDFFFCERHEPQSNCEITTNLLTPVRPSSMLVTTSSTPPNPVLDKSVVDTVIAVEEKIPLYVHLFDDDGKIRSDIEGNVTWQFVGPSGTPLRSDTVATEIVFTLPDVAGCVTLYQMFDDPLDSFPAIVNSVQICPANGGTPPDTGTPHDTSTTTPNDTSVTPHDTTTQPNDTTTMPHDTTAGVVDTIGAVVQRVLLYSGIGAAQFDTLRITLTDPVNCEKLHGITPEEVFNLSAAGSLSGARFIGGCDSALVTTVSIAVPVNTVVISPGSDSLALEGETPYVVDEKGSLPPKTSVPVAIEWGSTLIVIGSLTSNSSPATTIDEKIVVAFWRNFSEGLRGEKVGSFTALQTKVPLLPLENPPSQAGVGEIFGLAVVYDAVGNVLASNLPVKLSDTRNTYGVHWNMRNLNNRAVAKGTYLIMVSVTPGNTGKLIRKTVKVVAR